MGAIRVTPEELEAQASQVRSQADQVSQVLSTLQSQVADLATRWEGSGSSGFQALFEEWRQSASQVHEAMQGIANLLAQGAAVYRDADASVRSGTGH